MEASMLGAVEVEKSPDHETFDFARICFSVGV